MAPKPPSLPDDASDDANNTRTRRRDSQRDKGLDATRKDDGDKTREKRKMHRSMSGKNTAKMPSKSKSNVSSKRENMISASSRETPRALRHRRTLSNRSSSSTSESEEVDHENEVAEDHRAVLAAARGRLTSPSLLSTLTSLTTATNNSGGSSGSNSTVTQASMSRRPRPDPLNAEEVPISPAVPDPPNVFAFLEKDSPNSSDEEAEEQDYVPPNWPHPEPTPFIRPSTPDDSQPPRQRSTSSSASSSFHSDASELPEIADNDTDRSTSPERSVKSGGEDDVQSQKSPTCSRDSTSTSTLNPDPAMPTSPAAAKFAAQMLAAQHRQSLHNNLHQTHQRHPSYPHAFSAPYATPHPPQQQAHPPFAIQSLPSAQFQHFTFTPPVPSSQLAAPVQIHRSSKTKGKGRELAKAEAAQKERESRETSGYEALASALSNSSMDGSGLTVPVYRKFSCLNHRVLLHLQDEISELEDSLSVLDAADMRSRTSNSQMPAKSPKQDDRKGQVEIQPASRRAPRDRELEWHRSELVSRISSKLAQYNSTLTSFHNLENSLPPAPHSAISQYRAFISATAPVVEAETKFLEYPTDLVSVSQKRKQNDGMAFSGSSTPAVAVAVAASILLPILTFTVIPGFLGRMVVALLVAAGVLGSLVQSGVVGAGSVMHTEGAVVGGVYVGLMVVVAAVVA